MTMVIIYLKRLIALIENNAGMFSCFSGLFSLLVGFVALCLANTANNLSKQSVAISERSLSLAEKQTSVALSESEVRLFVTGLNQPKHLQLHNTPFTFAPRLRVVSGIVNGPATSETICSHVKSQGRDSTRSKPFSFVDFSSGEEMEGNTCEYQIGTETYTPGVYEYERLIHGRVFYKDRLNREYVYTWCRHTIRGSTEPFPPEPRVVSCDDMGIRDNTEVRTTTISRAYSN